MNTIFKDVVISVLSIGVTYFIAIKVKFAEDEKTATNNAKYFLFNIGLFLMYSFITYRLITEIMLPAPFTKTSLIIILLYSFTLFNGLVHLYISLLRKAIARDLCHICKQMQLNKKHEYQIIQEGRGMATFLFQHWHYTTPLNSSLCDRNIR